MSFITLQSDLGFKGITPPKFVNSQYNEHVDNPTDPSEVLGVGDQEINAKPRSRTNLLTEQVGVLASKRAEDLIRVSTKGINPIESPRYLVNQGILTIGNNGDSRDIVKTTTGIVSSTATAGTGLHLIFPPVINNQYLQKEDGDIDDVNNYTGDSEGSGVNGANEAYSTGNVQKGVVDSNFVTNNAGTNKSSLEGLSQGGDFNSDAVYLNYEGSDKQLAFDILSTTDKILPNDRSKYKSANNDYLVISRQENVESNFVKSSSGNTVQKTISTDIAKKVQEKSGKAFQNSFTEGLGSVIVSGSSTYSEKSVKIVKEGGNSEKVQSIGLRTKLVYTGVNSKDSLDVMDVKSIDLNRDSDVVDDIIPFNIEIYDPQKPEKYTLIKLRAYLDSMSDSFSGEWNGTKYIGRAEELYNYTGFSRDFSFAFKVAALSKEELVPLYNKLNTLVSTTAPAYDDEQNFMQGIFTKLTIGDYVHNLPGFFERVGLTWDVTYPWELGFENDQRLPHILNVDVTFKPIHNFNPRYGSRFIGKTG